MRSVRDPNSRTSRRSPARGRSRGDSDRSTRGGLTPSRNPSRDLPAAHPAAAALARRLAARGAPWFVEPPVGHVDLLAGHVRRAATARGRRPIGCWTATSINMLLAGITVESGEVDREPGVEGVRWSARSDRRTNGIGGLTLGAMTSPRQLEHQQPRHGPAHARARGCRWMLRRGAMC